MLQSWRHPIHLTSPDHPSVHSVPLDLIAVLTSVSTTSSSHRDAAQVQLLRPSCTCLPFLAGRRSLASIREATIVDRHRSRSLRCLRSFAFYAASSLQPQPNKLWYSIHHQLTANPWLFCRRVSSASTLHPQAHFTTSLARFRAERLDRLRVGIQSTLLITPKELFCARSYETLSLTLSDSSTTFSSTFWRDKQTIEQRTRLLISAFCRLSPTRLVASFEPSMQSTASEISDRRLP